MVYTFILNRWAGGGLFKRGATRLLEALPNAGLAYDVQTTEYPRHAVKLARDAAVRSDVVVAVGGDGTVNEVVSGLVQSERAAALAVIPTGTGNDFAKMLHIPANIESALAVLREPTMTKVDYGRLTWTGKEGGGSAVFVNAAGTGIDASVAAAAARIRLLSGTPRYIAAVIRTLRKWSAPFMEVEVYCLDAMVTSAASEHLLVLAGNGRCAAGGFYLTPGARIDDGVLDACIIRNANLGRILAIIPAVLRNGRHIHEPEVTLQQADKIVVRSPSSLPVQVDGEVIHAAANEIIFEVAKAQLSVVQPVKR